MKIIICLILIILLCGCQLNIFSIQRGSWIIKIGIIVPEEDMIEVYTATSMSELFNPWNQNKISK